MAARLLRNTRRMLAYRPNLRVLAKPARVFSSDSDHGILGPEDYRLPLPGNIGFSNELFKKNVKKPSIKPQADLLTKELPQERYTEVLTEVQKMNMLEMKLNAEMYADWLECFVQECPDLLKKDFSKLFLDVDVTNGPFTVITLSQKTKNDMSMWSECVEKEREELLFFFISFARDMCEKLEEAGYWADFIDPSSGRPYLGSYTNATFTETDERYRSLGFQIEDLGCCRVIEHHLWGTHAFIGSVFTDAPIDSEILKNVLDPYAHEFD